MVMPIIWQSTADGLSSVDGELIEVSRVYCFSFAKSLRYLYLPALMKAVLPALISSSGLAWKAGIAAEIITIARGSIGGEISNAKNAFEGAEMFAWTLTVILLSIAIEIILKRLIRRWRSV